jgi:predicted nucleotidyltransferase
MQDLKNDPQLQNALQILKTHFPIKKAFLFGSRAQNQAASESDYDLVLLVEETNLNAFERRVTARTLLKKLQQSFDVFIFTPEEFENSKNDFGSIVETAINTGQEIDFV